MVFVGDEFKPEGRESSYRPSDGLLGEVGFYLRPMVLARDERTKHSRLRFGFVNLPTNHREWIIIADCLPLERIILNYASPLY